MTPVSGITTEGNFRLCCLPARHYNIGKLSEFIISEARQNGTGENKLLELELVLEELLTNIVEHGYRDMSAAEPWFRAGIDASLCDILRLRIEDAGLPFNTSRRPDPRLEVSLPDREPGGHGLQLIHELTDEFAYERTVDGINRTSFTLSLIEPEHSDVKTAEQSDL